MPSTVVRSTRIRQLLDEWSLVLTAAGIEHETAVREGNYVIAVDSEAAQRAVALLSGYDGERRRPRRRPWAEAEGAVRLAWVMPVAILLGFMWTGPVTRGSFAFERGAAIATQIRSGELWRIATALTLHADAVHAASNALSSLVFLIPLSRMIGPGTAFAFSLVAGMIATLINAFVRGPGYAGIGASTAIFATVGLLAGIRSSSDDPRPFWRRFGPLGAALGILAMIGASPTTDVMAHLFGLLSGVGIGVLFASARDSAPSPAVDAVLGGIGIAVLCMAWVSALALP